jgi:hypothetical protein
MFGSKTHHTTHHPLKMVIALKIDTSKELGLKGIKKFQSLISAFIEEVGNPDWLF